MQGIYRLNGTVKHYDWGGFSFIPSLLKTGNKDHQPFAEYWMGVHPLGVSVLNCREGKQKSCLSISPAFLICSKYWM